MSPATASSSRDRQTAYCAPFTTCAGTAARVCAPTTPGISAAASSARTMRGPTVSTGGCSARRTWRRSRISGRKNFRCITVHVADWDGHLFVHLKADPPPLVATARRPSGEVQAWRMADLRLGRRIVYDVKANWKLIVQNYNECLHCPNLHPALNKLSHYLSGENEPLHASYIGGRMDLRPGVDTMSIDGTCPRAPLPGLSDDRSPARLLLRDLPEHAPQPAPGLHDGAHAVADRARPHGQRLRVALPAGGARARRASTPRTRSISGI